MTFWQRASLVLILVVLVAVLSQGDVEATRILAEDFTNTSRLTTYPSIYEKAKSNMELHHHWCRERLSPSSFQAVLLQPDSWISCPEGNVFTMVNESFAASSWVSAIYFLQLEVSSPSSSSPPSLCSCSGNAVNGGGVKLLVTSLVFPFFAIGLFPNFLQEKQTEEVTMDETEKRLDLKNRSMQEER
ncbi:hypothetical protein NE237_018778 [Protea cynaroides]|uniref:Uncharacterized protein n=1 Tax=Protea cynaroides TaxID=273540 RepID=A0A9Q0QPH2_9MAGN|nr:hypothetical protein NE237_018778 [Protea cynaroides]